MFVKIFCVLSVIFVSFSEASLSPKNDRIIDKIESSRAYFFLGHIAAFQAANYFLHPELWPAKPKTSLEIAASEYFVQQLQGLPIYVIWRQKPQTIYLVITAEDLSLVLNCLYKDISLSQLHEVYDNLLGTYDCYYKFSDKQIIDKVINTFNTLNAKLPRLLINLNGILDVETCLKSRSNYDRGGITRELLKLKFEDIVHLLSTTLDLFINSKQHYITKFDEYAVLALCQDLIYGDQSLVFTIPQALQELYAANGYKLHRYQALYLVWSALSEKGLKAYRTDACGKWLKKL